jgi:hypothetical protein
VRERHEKTIVGMRFAYIELRCYRQPIVEGARNALQSGKLLGGELLPAIPSCSSRIDGRSVCRGALKHCPG